MIAVPAYLAIDASLASDVRVGYHGTEASRSSRSRHHRQPDFRWNPLLLVTP